MRDDSASKKGTDDLHYCESSVPFFALSAQKSRAIRGGGANGISASPARDKAPHRKCRCVPNTEMDWAYKSGAEKILHAAQGRGYRLRNPPRMAAKRPDELRGGGGIQADCLLDAKEHPAGNYVRLFAEMYGKYISE